MGDCMGLFSKLKDVFKTKEKSNDEVKKYANKITDTVHNDGVAIGIKEFVFS